MSISRNFCSRKGMDMFVLNGLLLFTIVTASIPDTMVLGPSAKLVMEQDIPTNNKRCRYNLVYKMLQVNCSNLGVDNIPSHLKSNIQIMDIRVNRIRKLNDKSLAPYKDLAYLYLGDNFIQTIEEGVFSPLENLEVLDLSKNGCDELPSDIFKLPYLRKLYLMENKLTNAMLKIDVTSPLQFLALSNNRLTKIPELGILPSLAEMDVSDNSIASISTEDIAPYCSLKNLNFSGNPVRFSAGNCECQTFNNWTKERGIQVVPQLNCSATERCSNNITYSNRSMELFGNCTEILRVRVETQRARSVWIIVATSIGAFILCIFTVLYCIHKRNKRKQRKLKEEQRLAADNANTELVNSNLHAEQTKFDA